MVWGELMENLVEGDIDVAYLVGVNNWESLVVEGIETFEEK